MSTTPTQIRLTDHDKSLLADIAKAYGCNSLSAAVRLAIHRTHFQVAQESAMPQKKKPKKSQEGD